MEMFSTSSIRNHCSGQDRTWIQIQLNYANRCYHLLSLKRLPPGFSTIMCQTLLARPILAFPLPRPTWAATTTFRWNGPIVGNRCWQEKKLKQSIIFYLHKIKEQTNFIPTNNVVSFADHSKWFYIFPYLLGFCFLLLKEVFIGTGASIKNVV